MLFRYFLIMLLAVGALQACAQVLSTDDIEIYTEVHGEGDTTLLFIHGWNLDHSFWKNQIDTFSENYQVVVFDLPGYGQSGKEREQWTIRAYGRDVQRIISDLDLENVILIAHSMGGNIALEAIHEDPSRIIALVGVDNFKEVGTKPDSAMKARMEAFYAFLAEDYPANVRTASEGFMFSPDSPPGPKEEVLQAYASADPDIAIPVVKAAFSESENEMELLAALTVPFFLISADLIPVNEEGIRSHYHGPLFRNFDVKQSGHFPMYERPESFNEALVNILNILK